MHGGSPSLQRRHAANPSPKATRSAEKNHAAFGATARSAGLSAIYRVPDSMRARGELRFATCAGQLLQLVQTLARRAGALRGLERQTGVQESDEALLLVAGIGLGLTGARML